MGILLYSCVEVREPIELFFGVVSGFGQMMGVLAPIGFNGVFV